MDRFWSKVNRKSDTECWEWLASKSRGYGRFMLNGKGVSAHRFAYELIRGPIPSGMSIDHLCRNCGCVNPYHMEIVTHRINVLRGIGITAQNSKKTHCVHGHPLAGDNIIIRSDKKRECRECNRVGKKKSEQRRTLARRLARSAKNRGGRINVLIHHPIVGSLWLSNCEIKDGYVVGEFWDKSDVGSAYLPDDYMGEPCTMNFPVSCIRKQEE